MVVEELRTIGFTNMADYMKAEPDGPPRILSKFLPKAPPLPPARPPSPEARTHIELGPRDDRFSMPELIRSR
jgi:hypothetical protein